MSRLADVDQQFRTLHQETVNSYEENVKRQRELHQRWNAGRQEHEEDQLKTLRAFVPDLDRLKTCDETVLNECMNEVRPSLMERPNQSATDAKRFALHPGMQVPSARTVPVYAASLLAGDHATLEGVEGERGNPWVLPWNPGQIKIKDIRQDGSWGLCGWARPYVPPVIADVWFAFIPDTTAMWHFLALFNFHGFYFLQANKSFWNCKYSRATVDADLNVYQYFWNGDKKFPLLDVESENGVKFGSYEEPLQFDYQVALKADPQYYAFAKVRITINADAYGAGSFSEINFAEGAANFIDPLVLLAWHS
jgi:hypothetical protein